MSKETPLPIEKSAIISSNQLYRYELRRVWDKNLAPVNFVMLNPSTADGESDDPTIRKCCAFAKTWGYGGIIVTNLFAYRATDPALLEDTQKRGLINIHGRENWNWIKSAAKEADLVLCAWGARPFAQEQGARTAEFLEREGHKLWCITTTGKGAPAHPLYLKGTLTPTRYNPTGEPS